MAKKKSAKSSSAATKKASATVARKKVSKKVSRPAPVTKTEKKSVGTRIGDMLDSAGDGIAAAVDYLTPSSMRGSRDKSRKKQDAKGSSGKLVSKKSKSRSV